MVDALHRSAADLRRTAEDNAHAFKTPIAVIRQSIEPLRRALPEENQRAQRAIGVVEHSLDRLDGLVSSARQLDEATADLLAKPLVPVDLGRVIGGLIQIRSGILATHDVSIILASHDLTISADLLPGLFVLGTEEMVETVVENLIDNAVSFSPPGGEIVVHLTRDGRFAHLTVSDQGPGVPPEQLERIFDRYYSERRADMSGEASPSYFGIGLWIARRNVEAMGGDDCGRKFERRTEWPCTFGCRCRSTLRETTLTGNGSETEERAVDQDADPALRPRRGSDRAAGAR